MRTFKPLLALPILLLFILALEGCNKPADQAALNVVRTNLKACQDEDLSTYFHTLVSTEATEQNRRRIAQLFYYYNLQYDLSNLKLLSKTSNEAQVAFTQATHKIAGPEFRDTEISGIHTLVKENGQWKILKTNIESVKYLK